jgi:general secretion pathway protein D
MRSVIAMAASCVLILAVARTAAGETKTETVAAPADPDAAMYACGKPRGPFALSFKPEVELKELVTWAMGISCKQIFYNSALASRSAKITMLTPGTLAFSEAWALFQHALRAMGLAVVKKGKGLEIVESLAARDEALAIRRTFPDEGTELVRLLLRPEHVAVEDLKAALELVKSKNGVVAPLEKLRAVLVTDDAAHVARMRPLVEELDRPAAGDGVYAIPLDHVDAAGMVETLNDLLAPSAGAAAATGPAAASVAGSGAPPKLVAAPRVNAIFVVGTAGEYLRVRALAKALDLDLGDTARIQSFHLRNAAAKDVATTLSGLVAGTTSPSADSTRPRGPTAGDPSASTLTGPTRFAADEQSNTLLVLASPRDALAVRALVDDLDRPRRQVYIEALVLEVEAGTTREVGTSFHGGSGGDDQAIVGSFQSDAVSSIDPTTALASGGLVSGVLGKPLSGMLGDLLGTTVPSFGMLLKLAAHDSRLDVLSSPHLMVIDNKEAQISIGSNIPYQSTTGTTGTTLVTQPSVERAKVALTLKVTPHVAPADPGAVSDTVRLDIQLDSNQLGQEDYGGLGPAWKERTISTSVILRDQESVVLGGLVDERIEETVDKIPFLGDIPLLGALFRSTKKVRQKSNLLVVLTPHLIDDTVAGRRLLERRMRERDEFMTSAIDLERRVLEPEIDYRTKRGVVAEIAATLDRIDDEKAALAAAAASLTVPDGRIDEPATPPTAP